MMNALRKKTLKRCCAVAALVLIGTPVLACFSVRPPENGNPPPFATCEKVGMTLWRLFVPIEYQTDEAATLKWYVADFPVGEGEPTCDDVTDWGNPFDSASAVLGCASWTSDSESEDLQNAADQLFCWKVSMTPTGGGPVVSVVDDILCEAE